MNRCRRCLLFEAGYSATTASRSMLLSPNPATSNGRESAGRILSPSRTFRILLQSAAPLFTVNLVDLRLFFAYTFARREEGHAPAHETATRDSRLPERVHPAARLCAEPRGNRSPVWALLAGHGSQTPYEPAGQGLHQARLEPQPLGRAGADTDGRPRDRASPPRVCRRRRAD